MMPANSPRPARYEVLGLFSVLAMITYLDRVCISQAAGPIRDELGLDEIQLSWVFSAFTLAYTLFEIPSGWLGDRIGPRRVLVRIVVWWSLFTALSGAAWGLVPLLFVRFAFGAGEAGAFPSIARALAGWFTPAERGRAQGVIWTSARLGGAIAPPVTAALIQAVTWHWAFPILGVIGVVWALVFSWRYREAEAGALPSAHSHGIARAPWRAILTNRSVWGLAGATFWSAFSWFFFVTWMPIYLEKGRHLSLARASWLAALPLTFGVFGCALGGFLSDLLTSRFGSARWSRRLVGCAGALLAGTCFLLASRMVDPVAAVLLMALSSFWNDVPQSSLWAASMDIGERSAGVVSGVMNTASGLGALISPLIFGVILKRGWGWTPALTLAGAGFLMGAVFWLMVDPTRTVWKTHGISDFV